MQSVRNVLRALEINAPGYLSGDELLSLLIERFKACNGESSAQGALSDLLEELERDGTDYGACLPCPECETVSPQEFIAQLQLTLGQARERRFAQATIISACALLAVLARDPACAESLDCASDLSSGHIAQLAHTGTGVTTSEAARFATKVINQPETKQAETVKRLCVMSPQEIAQYVKETQIIRFGPSQEDPTKWSIGAVRLKERPLCT